jgi:hypothetical protein
MSSKAKSELAIKLHEAVKGVCGEIESLDLPIGSDQLGARVWVFPRFYFNSVVRDREALLSACGLLADSPARWPRMQKICEVRGGVSETSGIRWAIGKGLISKILASDPGTIVCQSNDQDFSKPGLKRNRRDVRKLKALYSCAVGIPLIDISAFRFGVLTVQVPRGQNQAALESEEMELCGKILVKSSAVISDLSRPFLA